MIAHEILAPLTAEQFLRDVWNRSPIHLPGKAGRFDGLLEWDSLARVLETRPLEPPRIALTRNGKAIADTLYLTRLNGLTYLNAGALSLLLDQGATLIINSVEALEPRLANLADAISEILPARAWVNLYATWRSEQGFALHWDDHDVIVLQLAGSKQWTVHAPTRVNPLKDDVFEPPPSDAQPAWSGLLNNGDVLYIPRGWSHMAAPTGDPSLHLTISLDQPTGSAYLHWLAGELEENAKVRSAIPPSNDKAAREAWLAEIRTAVEDALDLRSVDAFLDQEAAQYPARPKILLPSFGRLDPGLWSDDTLFRLAASRRLNITEQGGPSVSIASAGRELSCSAAIAPALRLLSSSRPVSLKQLEDSLNASDSKELRHTLALLVNIGLLFSENADQPRVT